MIPQFKVVRSDRKHDGKVFDLIVDEIEYASGHRALREVADHPGGAVAVPVFSDGKVLLIHQFRYPLKEFLYELPAGKLERGEDPMLCAARELEEETGYSAARLTKLTTIYTTPGFCTERLHIYLAQDLKKSETGQQLEEGEHLSMYIVEFERAIRMIDEGAITDSKTICGLLLAYRKLRGSMI